MDFSQMKTSDWVAIYGAFLSSLIALFAVLKWAIRKIRARDELAKFETDLYFLRKVDKSTKKIYPIVVVVLANLGRERILLKSLEYDGKSDNGLETNGFFGWYEQPEELFGIRKRLLPIVLESGKTADLPMIQIGVITRVRDLRIWLTDFDGKRHYLAEKDISNVRRDIEKFMSEKSADKK